MRDLSRAEGRFLGLPGARRPRSDAEAQPIEQVLVSFQARAFLTEGLYASGAYRGGALFGFHSEGDLSVQFATPAGYACGDLGLRQQPLVLDERFILGWSGALEATYPGKMSWVGNWLMYPDSQLAPLERDLEWLHEGLGTDLFNEDHVLLTVGWDLGVLSARALGYHRQTRQPLTFTHDLAGEE